MEQVVLTRVVEAAARLGAIHAFVRSGTLKPYMKRAEAFRLYGRKYVERWIAQGLITPRKDGNHSAAWRIDRLEIEALAVATSLLRYI
jgi:hypothetical protein